MRAHAGCVLQHGAILLDWDDRLQAGALGLADDAELRSHVTTLSAELGRAPDRAEVDAAVVRGLAGRLGIELPSGPISGDEAARETAIVSHFSIQTKLGRRP
jgi:lipoate-protein ligase A